MEKEDIVEKYFGAVNEIFGLFSVGIALACISTDNPKFYSWFSVVFVLLVWFSKFQKHRKEFKALKEQNHPALNYINILKHCYIALLGWLFLVAVALGYIDSSGVVP